MISTTFHLRRECRWQFFIDKLISEYEYGEANHNSEWSSIGRWWASIDAACSNWSCQAHMLRTYFPRPKIRIKFSKLYDQSCVKLQKEPALNAKMRRDGTMTVVNVKVERTSTDGLTKAPKKSNVAETTSKESIVAEKAPKESETARPVRIKKEKIDEPITSKTTNKDGATENGAKKNSNDDSNDSLEILPMETNPTIELSDDEHGNDVDKMPPPAFVPPVKATKEKKAPAEKKIRSTRSKVKRKV